jgi:hypothetical protein
MKLTSQMPSSTSLTPSFRPASGRTIRANAIHRNLCGDVPHDFGQLAGTDLVEEAIELDVLRNGRALAKQLDVVIERLLEVHDGEVIVIKQRRDISVVMIVKLLDNQLRRQGRHRMSGECAKTVGVVRALANKTLGPRRSYQGMSRRWFENIRRNRVRLRSAQTLAKPLR